MPIIPKIPERESHLKTCAQCGRSFDIEEFAPTHSYFYKDGHIPLCNSCVTYYLRENEFSWEAIDKVCQWADIPFIVKEWERISELTQPAQTWATYARTFSGDEYKSLGWIDYFRQYQKLKEASQIEYEIPLLDTKRIQDLQKKWGANYSPEQLDYLEDLYKGLVATQNINGALQIDQAQKICKLSLEIDSQIRAGSKDVDKFLSSYDKLVKTAEFNPKNSKDDNDFSSFGELAVWLEKRGRENQFYDGATRDVIDETIKNIQSYNQRLYINEGGIGDEITRRLKAIQEENSKEGVQTESSDMYGIQFEFDEDKYDNEGFEQFENEEFDGGGAIGGV